MNDLTKIDDICLISECNNNMIHHTRSMLTTFIRNNSWFYGKIVILTTESNPLTNYNVNLLRLIYNDIKIISISNSDINSLVLKVNKRKEYEKVIDYVKIFAFKIKSKGNLYIANNVSVIGDISNILNDDSVSIATSSESFPNLGAKLSSNLMYVPESSIRDDIFDRLYNALISSTLNGTDSSITEFISNNLAINQLNSNILVDASIFPNSKYTNLVRYAKSIAAVYMPHYIPSNDNYSKLRLFVNSIIGKSQRIDPRSTSNITRTSNKNPPPTVGINESDISISIIIPAYQAEGYIQDCIDSIISQTSPSKLEILIGIDNCISTRNKLNQIKDEYPNLQVFFSDTSVGPYIMRNSLLDFAKYDNILFFDADDIMKDTMVSTILKYYSNARPIRFKYVNFKDVKKYTSNTTPHPSVAHGVFFSSKEILDKIGGFQPWMCGADTEFMKRCTKNGIRDAEIQDYLFYRRIHGNSLTQNASTNHRSKVRDNAKRFIKTNKNWSIPINKKITELVPL